MQKFSLILCLILATGQGGLAEDSSSEENQLQLDEKVAEHQEPLHEIVHVHHVPVQIPVYASMVVHESHHQQAPHYQQQQHQNSHLSSGHYDFYSSEREAQAQSCSAPNGSGFKRLFREASDLLPKKEISDIIINAYKYDTEVSAFRKMLFSQETLDKLLTLRASTQFNEISDYACKRLFLNMRKFFKFLSCFIAAEEPEVGMESPINDSIEQEFKGRPGLRGMIKDIYEILPHEKLRQLYRRLKDSDRYLAYSVRRMKSPEFRDLAMNLRQVPEYQELKKSFVDAGLPIEEYNKLLAASLGWEDDIPEEVFQI